MFYGVVGVEVINRKGIIRIVEFCFLYWFNVWKGCRNLIEVKL